MTRVKNVMVDRFYVYVKRQGKKASYWVGDSFDDLKNAVKCAMSYKDRANTVYVKQDWYNPKSCHTGQKIVFECGDGNGNGYIQFK